MSAEVTVLLLASLGEALGQPRMLVALPNPMPLGALKQTLLDQQGPSWHLLLEPHIKCAVNFRVVTDQYMLQPGDEVAFFPPVTGG
jgi:molybdopterin converting factor small subunit